MLVSKMVSGGQTGVDRGAIAAAKACDFPYGGLLQFCRQEPEKKSALVEALYRYCELDTLAMVFIWEYFGDLMFLKN